ncbi:MAG: Ig-like domain-containing protein [Bacteroidales bacterium]|jgi:uncharacterized protein (TIGR02145 family)|nr:Ig-like domain-containing protein [Bacteroidales bacterium]
MMKKITFTLIAFAIAFVTIFAGCKKDKDPKDQNVAVTSVTLNKTTDTLAIDDVVTLTATVLPENATNKAVTWSISDSTVAKVANGTVTALKAGQTTITTTTKDGNKTAVCTITVKAAIVAVTSVTLDQTTDTLAIDDVVTLTATVLPEDATNKAITWSSSDSTVAKVANGTVTALKAGQATITVTTEDGNKTAVCTITVKLTKWDVAPYGMASFVTAQTWIVGNQEWSDAVQTTICSEKTDFDGGATGNYKVDCRSNPDYKGDLFSGEMINQHKTVLCPEGWRIPTKDDFIALNIALGGVDTDSTSAENIEFINANYLNPEVWGGTYGSVASGSDLNNQGTVAYYWSQTEATTERNNNLTMNNSGRIHPQDMSSKRYGLALRCVKDVE